MKIRKMTGGVALVAATALVLSACTSGSSDEDSTDTATDESSEGTDEGGSGEEAMYEGTDKEDLGDITTKDDTVSFSLGEDEWLGYNGNTPETYSTYNSVVNDRMQSGFTYFGTDGTIYVNEQFGNVELVSEDPMTVEYTIADDAVWSDGTPITYEDALFSWATQAFMQEDGETPLFNYVGGTDLGDRTPDGPQGEAGGKSFTLEYENPYPDYMIATMMQFPAHVAAEQAGVSLEDMTAAIQDGDTAALQPIADFYNEGWLSPTPGELPSADIALSSGPYQLSSWRPVSPSRWSRTPSGGAPRRPAARWSTASRRPRPRRRPCRTVTSTSSSRRPPSTP